MNGLTVDKLLVLAVIAVVLLGPERLPEYTQKLRRLIKQVKGMVDDAKGRAAEELGPDFEVDWKKLDPRQYDPRRIVREALLDDGKLAAESEDNVLEPRARGMALGGQVRRPGRKPDLQ